jgi:hypothetical protein
MSINGVSSFGAARNAAAMNTIADLVEVSQGVTSAKSQSIALDGNRQTQDIHNQVKDDQDALAQQTQESKKQKRRERRHKIFGWIFHPVKSATAKIVQHHDKKTGKTPKKHPALTMLHPVKLVNTLLHPRKAIRKIVTKVSHPVESMKNMFKPRGKEEGLGRISIKNIAKEAGVKDIGKMMNRLDRMKDSVRYATKVAEFSDAADTFVTGVQVDKIENKINQLKVDEQMWQNLEKMDEHDIDRDQQQLSDVLKDDASNVKSITAMLNAANKAQTSIVSNMSSHA